MSVIISNGCAVESMLLLIPAGAREGAQAHEGMADSCVNPSSPTSRAFSPSTLGDEHTCLALPPEQLR